MNKSFRISLLLLTALVAISISSIPVSALGGDISISTTPSGALIYLDDHYQGATPFIIKDVLPGSHTIKLTLNQYDDWTTIIDVVEGSTNTISETLNKTAIYFTSTPSGASIYVDNLNVGTTPFTKTQLLPGSHTIKLTLIQYDDWINTVNVVEGSTTPISATLNKTAIYLTSTPSNARIYVDNYDLGRYTPFTITQLSPGSHTIKLTFSKYDDWINTVNVVEGNTTTVHAGLSIKGSTQNPAPTYTTTPTLTSTPMDSLEFTIIDIQKSSETSPEINIEPIDKQEQSNTTVFLSGYASSDSGIESVTVNGQYAGTENWIAPIDFSGDGNIVIIATGNDGNTTIQNIGPESPASDPENKYYQILAALIIAFATIIGAYIGYRAIKKK
jgi:PEGA domain